jgi:hypothetical protein
VPVHAQAAAAGPADIAGGERHVHRRPVGAVVVVAPDQALLAGEHGPAPLAVLWLGDPVGGLLGLVDGKAGDLGRLLQGRLVRGDGLVEAGRARGKELPIMIALPNPLVALRCDNQRIMQPSCAAFPGTIFRTFRKWRLTGGPRRPRFVP